MSFFFEFVKNNFFTHAHKMEIKQINSCTLLHCLPFQVKNKKVVLTETKFSKTMEKANLLISTILLSIFFLKLVYKAKTAELKITQMLLYAGWSTLILCNYIFKLQYFSLDFQCKEVLEGWEIEETVLAVLHFRKEEFYYILMMIMPSKTYPIPILDDLTLALLILLLFALLHEGAKCCF